MDIPLLVKSEIETAVIAILQKHSLVKSGMEAMIDISLNYRPPVIKVRPEGKKRQVRVKEHKFTQLDWEEISALPWDDNLRKVMEKVRSRTPPALAQEDGWAAVKNQNNFWACSNLAQRFNVVFRRYHTLFRFTNMGGDWATGPFWLGKA